MKDKLRLGVVGVGQFGRHHARVYSELEDVLLVGVADTSVDRADAVARRHGAAAFADYRMLFDRVDAVSVVVPAAAHAAVSCDFLSRGISVLVEKPMAATLADALRMQAAAKTAGARLQVGHIMRFSPLVHAMREMDLVPRFLDIHRMGPFAFRALDVGVVLDMMIHDIDLVLCLVHSRVEKVDATAFAVVGPHEDVANARVVFADGCVASLTASRVSPGARRTARIFSADACLSVDFQAHTAHILRKLPGFSLDAADVEKTSTLSPEDLKKFAPAEPFAPREIKLEEEEPLKAELRSFVTSVRDGRTPEVSSEDGVRSMELAEKILDAARKK